MAYVTSPARTGTLSEKIRAAFAQLSDQFAKRRLYRTTLNELSGLSNRELADLGIARAELRRIAWEASRGIDPRG